jgi:pyruvate-formate lyase-activating enzyme
MGKMNDIINENLTYLARLNKDILVRVLLIDGITNMESNKNDLEKIVRQLDLGIPMEFLRYNLLDH